MWHLYYPLLALAAYIFYTRFLHPLSRVPGPFLASLAPLWLAWQCMHTRRPRLDLDLHKRYGSVVRITPDEVIFSSPEYFKTVYGAGTKYVKSRYYEAPVGMPQKEGWDKLDLLVETDVEKLRVQKRTAGPIYSTANVKKHEGLINNNIARWLQRLKGLAGKPLHLYHEIELLNVDTVCEVTFKKPFGAVEAGSDGGHMESIWAHWEHVGWLGFLPWLNTVEKKLMPWMASLLPAPKVPVFYFARNQIDSHQKARDAGGQEELPECMHTDFHRLAKEKPDFRANWGSQLSKTNIGAGIDTMSQTMSAVIIGVCQTPSAYAQLRAELDTAVTSGLITKGDEPVSYDAAAGLLYLQACMHEAMRLWPNVAIALPRTVPRGGVEIDGYYIPEGYTVGMNPRQLGRNEEVFGAETDSFRPERWLEASKERRNDMQGRNLAFGGPSRRCPGMHLAWFVCSKTLASLFLNFDLKVLNELDGPPGPGGGKWVEQGAFPTRWHGWEVEVTPR
ncbi:Uu.00g048200.m01.CDS01 [Anthostomella pinea]|uniref:Uu.00g048200.m01.CDS01 n=1 Tax=Anthostomella pinea TaxID=933095 RepID=A0AAI8VC73_9PEZI|nr:Uu.00g048200.m01.CDS01 [Anthostomella pinea]